MQRAALAACHAQLGDAAAAEQAPAGALALAPTLRRSREYLATLHYRDPATASTTAQALERAGFPP